MHFEEWLMSGIRITLPLLFAALGGMFSEKTGIANIALEAFLLVSSFTSAAVMAATHSFPISFAAGFAAALVLGIIFAFFTVTAKADQIIVGMALNILVSGILPVLSKALYGVSGQTPSLALQDRVSSTWPFIIAGILIFAFVLFVFRKTIFGLHILAAGDNPHALRTQGVSVEKLRWKSILVGSLIVAIGGIYLSMGAGSGYTRNMSAGRGFIALAALIFGRWKPWPTFMACLFFGILDALQIFLQNLLPFHIPTQLIQAVPYIITLLFLAGLSGRSNAPKAINQPNL